MSCLGGGPGATLSPPPPRTGRRGSVGANNNNAYSSRLSVQPLEVAAHWLQRRALTRARRTLTAVGARFVVSRADAPGATCPPGTPGAPPARRVVHLGGEQEDDVDLASNRISTAKYNVLTFFPLFLFSMVRAFLRVLLTR
jgi:hypothetical protein